MPFDENRIIVKIKAGDNNLFCIDKTGKTLWIAESISSKVYIPYQAFAIRDGYVYALGYMSSMGYNAKIDPENGKILEKEYVK